MQSAGVWVKWERACRGSRGGCHAHVDCIYADSARIRAVCEPAGTALVFPVSRRCDGALQLLLSSGMPDRYRRDWRKMRALSCRLRPAHTGPAATAIRPQSEEDPAALTAKLLINQARRCRPWRPARPRAIAR